MANKINFLFETVSTFVDTINDTLNLTTLIEYI